MCLYATRLYVKSRGYSLRRRQRVRSTMKINEIIELNIVLSLILIWKINASVTFSRGFEAMDIITRVRGVSLKQCELQCGRRPLCKSAVYHRRSGLCVMTSSSRDGKDTTSIPGAILLEGINQLKPSTCDGNICSLEETCVASQLGSPVCTITECTGTLPTFYGNGLGNVNSVGSRRLFVGDPSNMAVSCGQEGQWLLDSSHTVYDCTDIFGTSGVYKVSQNNVYCDMDTDEGHWLVFQRREDGSVDFHRQWLDYRNGFGNLEGEFWLGLELVYQILVNGGKYELRIDLEDFNGDTRYAKYSTFSIENEAEFYRLNVSGYSGDAGDSLTRHSGSNFTTPDSDNDESKCCNCAEFFEGAWWFYDCHRSHLNGVYYQNGHNTTEFGKHVIWQAWHGHWFSLKTTAMKMRRKWNT